MAKMELEAWSGKTLAVAGKDHLEAEGQGCKVLSLRSLSEP